MGSYELFCPGCGHAIPDHYTLNCTCGAGLIRAEYAAKTANTAKPAGHVEILRLASL